MKSITRAFSALLFTGTLLASASAFAATPFDIATRAYRGQLDGISGYQSLSQDLNSGKVTVEDILNAAGEAPTPELERSVASFLGNLDNDD